MAGIFHWKHGKQKSNRSGVATKFNPNPMSSRTILSITGMHCASCAAIITRKLKKTSGVTEANVNYGANKANIVYDESVVGIPALIEVITKAGYGAAIASTVDRDEEKRRKAAEIAVYRRKFFIGLLLSLPMLYFMAGALLPSLVPPALSAVEGWMGIISILLATPVQFWLGASFYHSAWSALRVRTFNMDSLIAIGTREQLASLESFCGRSEGNEQS